MSIARFFQTVKNSMTNPAYIASRIQERTGKAIGYIIIVLFIVSSLSGLVKGIYFNSYINQVLLQVEDRNFPDFHLSNGCFYIDSDQPIVISNEDMIFIIDTSGSKNINDIMNYKVGYLLNETTFIMNSNGETNYISLELLSFYNITKSEFVESLSLMSSIGIFLYMVGNMIIAFLGTFFRSLILLMLSFLMVKMLQIKDLKASRIYSLVLHSITIGVILYELASVLPYVLNAPIVSQMFYLAGSFVFFYFPSTTVMSRAFRYMKLHEEVQRLSTIIQDQKARKKKQDQKLNRYRRLDDQNQVDNTKDIPDLDNRSIDDSSNDKKPSDTNKKVDSDDSQDSDNN